MRVLIAVSLLLPPVAWGQGFNVDLDVFDGGPTVGEGAPSNAFGAAADQPGRWNQLNASQHAPHRLVDVTGQLTDVWLSRVGASQAGGWNNPQNTGDYRLLLNDAAGLGSASVAWTFEGLRAGWYRVYTYAVSPIPQHTEPRPVEVFVAGSVSANPQIVTGPMPGNSLQFLITHSIHELYVTDGLARVQVTRTLQEEQYVNGFQLVAVPEPISAITLVAGFVVLALRKRRSAN